MRSEFEKAYEPNPHKSPFTEVRFNEEKQIYESLNQPLDRVARSLNAAWYGYRIRQTEVDDLQKRVDAAKYYMKNIFSGDAEVDQCHLGDLLDILDGKIVDEIEQALKGGES